MAVFKCRICESTSEKETIYGVVFCKECGCYCIDPNAVAKIDESIAVIKEYRNKNRDELYYLQNKVINGTAQKNSFYEDLETFCHYETIYKDIDIRKADLDNKGEIHYDKWLYPFLMAIRNICNEIKKKIKTSANRR